MRPNVLMIVLDTARSDAVEPYGSDATTPVIAQLARRGHALDGRATACWTLPSHASMFTGLMPTAAGLSRAPGGTPVGCKPVLEAQRDRLLPEVFRRHGYATAGVSTNLWLTEATGFATGFDRFATVRSHRQARLDASGVRERASWLAEGYRARSDDGGSEAAAIVLDWIREPSDKPFFWFVNLVECHSPYLPPRPFNDLGPLDRLRAAEDARRYQTMDAIWKACAGAMRVPDESLQRMRHLYDASVRALDDWVGRVLEGLEAAGNLDQTLVVLVSDHGENFGEAGLMGHAFSLDERLTRVPLIVAGPGAAKVDGPVSLRRLPALLADGAGIADHPWNGAADLNGIALAQFDSPAAREDPRWDEAMDEWQLDAEQRERFGAPIRSATDGRWKLVRHGGSEALFDLASEAGENRPLEPEPGDAAVARLREALDRPEEPIAALNDAARNAPDVDQEELEDLEERMKLLGYM